MKGSIDISEQLRTAIKTAYQHGPMSWTQLKVMIAIVDPTLDEVLSKKFDEHDINRNIFNTLFYISCEQDHSYDEDLAMYRHMQDTMLQLFLTQDYIVEFKLDLVALMRLIQKIKHESTFSSSSFAKKLQRAIYKRIKLSISDEKLTEKDISQ